MKKKQKDKKISMFPLDVDQALSATLRVKPPPKRNKKKKAVKKAGTKKK